MIEKSFSKPLITLHNITREVSSEKESRRKLLQNVSWKLNEGQRVGIISKSMQETHAFLDCAAGVSTPQKGNVLISANVSWPLGAKGGMSSSLSGRQNAKFLQGIYGRGGQQRRDLNEIERLAELENNYFDKPVKGYNKAMRARFYLAVSLAFEFDVYIVPQQLAWKSNTNSDKSLQLQQALRDRIAGKSLLMTSTDFNFIAQFCDDGVVLKQGSIAYSGTFSDCRSWYETNIRKAPDEDINSALDSVESVSTSEPESDILEEGLW